MEPPQMASGTGRDRSGWLGAMAMAPRLILPAATVIYGLSTLLSVAPQMLSPYTLGFLSSLNWSDGTGPQAFDRSFSSNDLRHNLARDWAGLIRMAVFNQSRDGVVIGESGWMFNQDDFAAMRSTGVEIAQAADKVRMAVEELNSHGTDVTVVLVPYKIEVKADMVDAGDLEHAVRDVRLEFKGLLETSGIRVVDPAEEMLEQVKAEGETTIKTDQHWSVFGASVVAAEVARQLGVPSSDQGIELRYLPLETFQGDLATAIGGPWVVDHAGVQLEVAQPPVAVDRDGAVLNPEWQAVGTVLIGTSASENPRWGFAASLSFQLQEPIANLAVSGNGPIYPMLEAQKLFAEAGHYPGRVIWEFTLPSIYVPEHMSGAGALPTPWL